MRSQSVTQEIHEAIERLAYRLWEARGRPLGPSEVDWCNAEHILLNSSFGPPLSCFNFAANEGPYC